MKEKRKSSYLLYWMQQSQRSQSNKALEFAIKKANELKVPVITVFVLVSYPEAQKEHYRFMLQGLAETKERLEERGIGFILKKGNPEEIIAALSQDSAYLVMDKGYLKIQRKWRRTVLERVNCPARIIDADCIVPVEQVSDKAEIGARTLRPKIKRNLPEYLQGILATELLFPGREHQLVSENTGEQQEIFRQFLSGENFGSKAFSGGIRSADMLLKTFIDDKLNVYHTDSNDPSLDICSRMSPYLHFGQISALEIALRITESSACEEAKDAYLEQLIVRRELAVNFVWYNPEYDQYKSAVPGWAQKSLQIHARDKREFIYSLEELEFAQTHDDYWNAAQIQLTKTSFMHNYMRMYWGKKIIEWTKSPEQAFAWMIYLNNKYQLDGRDANSYTGIAWCFGNHDHPWKERDIFGKVRYMNARGLERKFKIKNYLEKIKNLDG